jgi:hypothetical protein
MTTFTLKDYIDNLTLREKRQIVEMIEEREKRQKEENIEPIPFAGLVALQDKEDTEAMLRHQLQIVQAECMRLKTLLTKHGIQH